MPNYATWKKYEQKITAYIIQRLNHSLIAVPVLRITMKTTVIDNEQCWNIHAPKTPTIIIINNRKTYLLSTFIWTMPAPFVCLSWAMCFFLWSCWFRFFVCVRVFLSFTDGAFHCMACKLTGTLHVAQHPNAGPYDVGNHLQKIENPVKSAYTQSKT